MKNDAAAFLLLNGLDAFVEVSTFGRHTFDKFTEEMGAVYALRAALTLFVYDHFAFMLPFALIRKPKISILQVSYKVVCLEL